ncbi:L-threonylcarbamoyladenylate synthase [Moraxella marmotae]|uniref:L-threonylcarbamoyladenylate synthase n=1 Tax=Moraxella marmotae TaxID=3344520 RepID=UPI0035F36E59
MPKSKLIFTPDELPATADYLKQGGVLAYPSESVWGIGCDAFDEVALSQIVALKNRNLGKGLIVLTDTAERLLPLFADVSHETAQRYLQHIQSQSLHFVKQHQRAITWLVPVAKDKLPRILTGDFGTLAVRITPHPILQKLCQNLASDANPYGFLVSTSCNPSGQSPAKNLTQAVKYFGHRLAYLDAVGLGFVQPSCIMDLVTGQVVR